MVSVDKSVLMKAFEHGPAWRWHQAQLEIRRRHPCKMRCADLDVRNAKAYLRRCAASSGDKAAAAHQFPLIGAAEALADNSAVANQLKVLVLGNCPAEQIAARTQIDGGAGDAL
ncbi:MAG TPA: hypothetical protein VGY66_32525 [Gemmataceae bacterium]|jgi:hypothetical protein|nr:hypothetical protein [Gemmataceae bacterium]